MHSSKGLGQLAPDPAQAVTVDGVKVPLGKEIKTGVTNPRGYTLMYNEFIVYNVKQIKFRYAIKLKFSLRAAPATPPHSRPRRPPLLALLALPCDPPAQLT